LIRLGNFLSAYHAANGTKAVEGSSHVTEAIRLIEENAEAKRNMDALGRMTETLFDRTKITDPNAVAISIEPEVTSADA
ncbi:MAG: hypothetical protein V3V01_17915, partial [Acidimicrobiales bacterium]